MEYKAKRNCSPFFWTLDQANKIPKKYADNHKVSRFIQFFFSFAWNLEENENMAKNYSSNAVYLLIHIWQLRDNFQCFSSMLSIWWKLLEKVFFLVLFIVRWMFYEEIKCLNKKRRIELFNQQKFLNKFFKVEKITIVWSFQQINSW